MEWNQLFFTLIQKLKKMWTKDQIWKLIDKRRDNNEDYHDLAEGGKQMFWKQTASEINLQFGTRFSGK